MDMSEDKDIQICVRVILESLQNAASDAAMFTLQGRKDCIFRTDDLDADVISETLCDLDEEQQQIYSQMLLWKRRLQAACAEVSAVL